MMFGLPCLPACCVQNTPYVLILSAMIAAILFLQAAAQGAPGAQQPEELSAVLTSMFGEQQLQPLLSQCYLLRDWPKALSVVSLVVAASDYVLLHP
jgi:hypothetical protein